RGDGAHDRRAERVQDVLRRGLAGRARDPDDARAASLADRRSKRADRGKRVAAAARERASARKSFPGPIATKRSPGSTRRESILTPVIWSALASRRPASSCSTSAIVSGITPAPWRF